jgi:hypothetical protein
MKISELIGVSMQYSFFLKTSLVRQQAQEKYFCSLISLIFVPSGAMENKLIEQFFNKK